MQTYISILRGINVSGQKPVKMQALKRSCEKMGFQNVHTYIQSGNVVFRAEEADVHELAQQMRVNIEKDFGFNVPVIVMHTEQLQQIIQRNPFANDPAKSPAHLAVTFLASEPSGFHREEIEAKKAGSEEIAFTPQALYLYCPHGFGRTKLNNNFLEKKLGVEATTRNWKTTQTLFDIALKIS